MDSEGFAHLANNARILLLWGMPWARIVLFFMLSLIPALAGLWLEFTWSRMNSEAYVTRYVSIRLTAHVLAAQQKLASFRGFETEGQRNMFLFAGDTLERWSEHDFLPDFGRISHAPEMQFVISARSNFIALRRPLDGNRAVLVIINLQDKYPFSNRYLSTALVPAFFPISQGLLLPPDAMVGLPIEVAGKPLFRLAILSPVNHPPATLWLFVASSLLFLGVLLRAVYVMHRKSPGRAFLLFTGGVAILRAIQLACEFPRTWMKGPLFDPQVFASSYLNFSLGDLLINGILVLAVVGYGYSRWLPTLGEHQFSIRQGSIAQVIGFLALCFTILFPYLFFESVYHNSALTIDITDSLEIDSRRVVVFASILTGLFSGWLVALAVFRFLLGQREIGLPTVFAFVCALALFVLYAYVEKRNYLIPTLLIVVAVLSASLLAKRWNFDSRWHLFLAVVFCGYAALSVYFLGEERKADHQQRFAERDLSTRDELGEYLLNEVNAKIAADPFILSVWNNPLRNRTAIKEKIKRVFLRNYFDQYDVSIQLFDASGEYTQDEVDADLASFLAARAEQSLPTGYPGVSIIQSSNLLSVRNYRVVTRVGRGPRMAGYVVVDLNLKRAIPATVFPEVLVDEKRMQHTQFGTYSYAWWVKDKILNSFGNFDYRQLDITTVPHAGSFRKLGFEHMAFQEDSGRLLIVSRPAYAGVFWLANFCFILLSGAFVWGVVALLVQRRKILRWGQRTYAQRMQLATLLSAAIPFLIIAIVLFQLIRSTSREQLNAQFMMRARNLSEALEGQLPGREDDQDLDRLRRLTDFDFSIFNRKGMLLATNQPAVYDLHVLSRLLSPQVLSELSVHSPVVRDEKIGSLSFKTCYLPVRSDDPEAQAILAVPFFDFDRFNEQSEIRTLYLLLILFVGVGLFAAGLSVRLTRQLVRPLAWLAQTLSQTTFRQSPTRLEWSRQDELGMLVEAYNRMLANWTEATARLSRKEKESAWQEMAKQVAHEIKNPLTPMKLTLQQLQVLQARQDLSERKVGEAITSLLHQVELLNEIATSFSAFAGMPKPKLEQLNVRTVLDRVVGLYRDQGTGSVEVRQDAGSVFVHADEKILSRAFSNILLNAWQSTDRSVHVLIHIQPDAGGVTIRFTDDGPGIPEEIRSKIFSPSFTTKQGGSGLGLAISKEGIELCLGAIRFETTLGVGTTFDIFLPSGEAGAIGP